MKGVEGSKGKVRCDKERGTMHVKRGAMCERGEVRWRSEIELQFAAR